MTLFLKYRPQNILDLDSEIIASRITTIFSSQYIPHAFLFAGSKGTGKTSTARIVAKIFNCENLNIGGGKTPKDPNPCLKCASCLAIAKGQFLDVIEIDAASNRGIDEMRELREKIKFTPVSGKVKVYIIDEVHMLTTEAFNALLKTLEEPPSHAVFILATTQEEKLPDTIRSRCTVLTFHKATSDELIHSLKRVTEGEKITIDAAVIERIAKSADGSFRDATKLLEQAIAEKSTTVEGIAILLGRDSRHATTLLDRLVEKNTTNALKEINTLMSQGASMRFLVEDILFSLHTILLVQQKVEENTDLSVISKKLSTQEVLSLIKLFTRTYQEIKTSPSPLIPVEVALVEWCEAKSIK